jgi:hypothetical protein
MARILSRRFDQLGGGAGFVGAFRAWAMRSCDTSVDIRFDKAERAAQAFQIAQGKVGLLPCLVTWSAPLAALRARSVAGRAASKALSASWAARRSESIRVLMSAGV